MVYREVVCFGASRSAILSKSFYRFKMSELCLKVEQKIAPHCTFHPVWYNGLWNAITSDPRMVQRLKGALAKLRNSTTDILECLTLICKIRSLVNNFEVNMTCSAD